MNDAAAALAAAAAERGKGITFALCYMAASLLAEGRLAVVVGRFSLQPVPIRLAILRRVAWR